MVIQPDMSDQLNSLFQDLVNNDIVSLYSYQEKMATTLLSGDNIILKTPTGAGKTWATLLPFLYSHKTGKSFVDRVLYALPLRALASQLYGSTKEACSKAGWHVMDTPDHVYGASRANKNSLCVTIQTGEQQDDPFFQGDIIFTTIDQLLSSYLFSPVSLPGRLANINAGALLGSLIVFDEFHLLEPERSMGTAIEMLDRIKQYCRFVLMTATLSAEAINWLADHLDAKIIDLDESEVAAIERQKQVPTRRIWEYMDNSMIAKEILTDHLQCRRSLILTNTVGRAQQIYQELLLARDVAGVTPEPKIALLHSRYYSDDRAKKEEEVNLRFGKLGQSKLENFILVSNQVVEAGMDFSVDMLHSELAPINSLIQRAGRCARYGGEGRVKIYPVPNKAPYSVGMDETSAVLCKLSGKILTATDERRIVDEVHGTNEKLALEEYSNLYCRRERVNQAMDAFLPGSVEELVRDINSINVLVTTNPEAICFDGFGRWPEMLSVPVSTLRGFLAKTLAKEHGKWVAAVPVAENSNSGAEDQGLCFQWQLLTSAKTELSWLVVINPDHACYSAELGLVLGKASSEQQPRYNSRKAQASYHYRYETYQEHVRQVLEQFRGATRKEKYACRQLACNLNVPEKIVTQAVCLAVIFHDVGKLSTEWQKNIKEWQKFKTPSRTLGELLAHSDFNPEIDWDTQSRFPRRPTHAVEGAYAVCGYLFNGIFKDYPDVAACVLTSIARHHTGNASTLKDFQLVSEARNVVNTGLSALKLPLIEELQDSPDVLIRGKGGDFARELLSATREEDQKWLPLYWHIVRQLRLADQAGTAVGGQKT